MRFMVGDFELKEPIVDMVAVVGMVRLWVRLWL